jgi:catechol 2,3-dioxygenase-like lactoylglutathione lyase family enzyme
VPQRLITHVRHIDLAVPDFDTQVDFYRDTWGLSEVATDSGLSFLAAEGSPEQYAVRIRQDEVKRVDLIAFGAKDRSDVEALATRLTASGAKLVTEPGSLDTPGGGYGFRFFDGDGRTVEVSADVAVRQHRKIEEGESIPVALSHVVFNSPNPESTVQWYVENLDFAVTDQLIHPHMGEMMWFLRVSPQHHTIAIARCPHHSLHHASFEMRGIDEYMRGTGRLLRLGVEKIWGPGRHKAGNNTFSYFLDPAGNTVEYTTAMENIDEDIWHPSKYDFTFLDVQDQWGTANQMNEFVAQKSFNDPDRGLFTAPPV